MSDLDPATAEWLIGEVGLRSVDIATSELDRGADEIAIVGATRRTVDDADRAAAVITAAVARRRARRRWAAAEHLLFTRSALEQASDPAVASWRAQRFAGHVVHDLCCGVGGDTAALAHHAAAVTALDRDRSRLVLLGHNLGVLGAVASAVHGDALTPVTDRDAVVHVDPARRDGGRRLTDPRSTVPPVDRLLDAHRGTAGVGVVCAPGVDHDHPALPEDAEVEYVQLGEDLIEASVWTGVLRGDRAVASATLLSAGPPGVAVTHGAPVTGHHLQRTGPRSAELPVGAIGDHLVAVATAAIRARLHDDLGGDIGARRLARRRALLTVDGPPPPSPWYRARPVLAVLPARPRVVRRWLTTNDPGPVELVLHGLEADLGRWWRDLGRPPRGPQGVRIELVRRDDDAVAVLTDDTGGS